MTELMEEFGIQVDSRGWPLHATPVAPLDLERLDELAAGCDHATRRRWEKMSRWLKEPRMYRRVPNDDWSRRPPRTSKLDAQDMCTIEASKLSEELKPGQEPKGFVRTFPTPQPAKRRRRWINHTVSINDYAKKLPLSLPGLKNLRESLYDGSHAVALDMHQWFHQFILTEGVSMYMCYEQTSPSHRDGTEATETKVYRLTRLPMGMRQSCSIAQAALDVLTFGLRAIGYIDNVKITGTSEECRRDCSEFLRRCKLIGATVNEESREPTEVVEYLGVRLDHEQKTISLGSKSVEKVMLCQAQLRIKPVITAGQLCSVMGVLFYVHWIYRSTLGDTTMWHWRSMHAYSRAGRRLQAHPQAIDEVFEISAEETKDILQWLHEAVNVGPAFVANAASLDTTVLITDASKKRWHGIVWDMCTGDLRECGGDFPQEEKSSVAAEPVAVIRASSSLLARRDHYWRLLIATDHQSMLSSLEKGYSANPKYNRVVQHLRRQFPGAILQGMYLPGAYNPADEGSRGEPTDQDKLQHAMRLICQNGLTCQPVVIPLGTEESGSDSSGEED